MATPPNNDPAKKNPNENSGLKRRPTDQFTPGSGLINPAELTTQPPAYSDDVTTTTPAIGDDLLGPGRLDAGRSEPSEPNAVIGPITKRRARTSPYQEPTPDLNLKGDSGKPEKPAKKSKKLKGDGDDGDARKPKKSLPRRILKGFLWTIAILLLLIGAALAFFHTGPGKSVARGIVESGLGKRYPRGEVTIGDLDYALGGDVEITDLKISEKGGKNVVHLHHLLLTLDWGSLLSKPLTIENLAIDGLDVDLVQFADGTNNLNRMQDEPTKAPEQLVIQALSLSQVNVQIENPAGQKTKINDLAMAAALAFDTPAGTLDLNLTNLSGKLDNAKLMVDFALAAKAKRVGANIEASIEPKGIKVVRKGPDGALLEPIDVMMKPLQVSTKDGIAELTFGGLAAGPLSIAGMHMRGQLPTAGNVALVGDILFELTGVKVDHVGLNKLLGREALVSDIGVDATVKGPAQALLVDGKVKTDGGTIALTGTVNIADLTNPIAHLELASESLDTTKILAPKVMPDGTTQQTDVQTSLKATIDAQGLPPNNTFKLHADVGKTTVRGKSIDSVVIDAHGKGPVLTLDGLALTAFGQVVRLDGEFDRDSREFRGALAMQTVLGDAIQKARDAGVLITPLPPIQGLLDIDLGIQGRLKPVPVPVAGVETPPATPFDPKALLVNGRLDFSSLPVETMAIKGKIKGKDIVVQSNEPGQPSKKIGDLDVDLDLAIEGGKPDGLKGQLLAKIGALDTGKATLDSGEIKVIFAGLTQDITITARDEKSALALDVAMQSVLDLDKRHVDITVSRLDAKRAAAETHLESPVTIGVDSSLDGKQEIKVPPTKLALAGGTLAVAVSAKLSKDEANPGATKIDAFDLSLDLESIDIGRLAGLAKRSTRGLSGKLDANVHAQGSKENPQVEFFGSVHGRMKRADPFTAKFDGALRDKKLDLDLTVSDRGNKKPLFSLDVMAPLNLPTTPGAKPSLGAGRFSVKAELPETTLSRLGALMPDGLPPTLDPDANIAFGLDLSGTTNRPTGDWHLDFEGDLLRRRGYEKAPAKQKVAIVGSLKPEGTIIALSNDFDFHLDANGPATIAHHTAGTFARSPLLKGFMDKPWTLVAGLEKPIDLSLAYELGLAKKPIAGTFTTSADLHGAGADVLGTLDLALANVRVGTAPEANVKGLVTIGEADIRVSQKINAAGLEALVIDALIGVPGKGLRTLIKDRPRLMRAPISGEIRLVEHAVAEWKKALAANNIKLPDLPGNVGGTLTLGGNLATPTAQGAFAWDGFDTVAGAPGRVAFEVDAGPERAEGGLAIGAQREITIRAGVLRSDLKRPAEGIAPPLPIDLAMKADKVDLMRVVPAFATAGKPFKMQGTLDWDMTGKLFSSRDPDHPGLAAGSHLVGDMVVSSLDIEVPDTDRHIRDGRMAFKATREALEIAGIDVREGRFPHIEGLIVPASLSADDPATGDRSVTITGRVPWVDLKAKDATLDVKSHDWLIGGKGFDGPEGELDIHMHIEARQLTEPIKAIDVTIASLDLYSPERFVRAHYPQFPAYDDVVYLDGKPAGVLPPGKGAPVPIDPNAPPPEVVDPSLPPKPIAGFDIRLMIPEEIHIILDSASPLELRMKGGMDVTMRDKDLNLKGRIDVTEGTLGAMGREFSLQTGAITADGGLDTAKAELHFAVHPSEIALRDVAAGGHNDLATITVTATAKTGLVTTFGGVSGPYLLDMATFLNTGRARMWGMPDVPSSETVRFGNPDQGLVVTFIQTNLRNLIFMDRANGWSESLEEPSEYGRLRFFDMQRFVSDGGARIHFTAQPVEIGQNRMELGYDWLFVNSPNTVFGFGPHLGTDMRAGLGFTLDWSSKN